jgi:hypothetical protein
MDNYFAQPPQPQQRSGMMAYLLGMGPMPPPHPAEIAVARVMYGLDHPELQEHAEVHQLRAIREGMEKDSAWGMLC